MILAALLEGMEGLTTYRHPNLVAALCSASGALAAALLAEIFPTQACDPKDPDTAPGLASERMLLIDHNPNRAS